MVLLLLSRVWGATIPSDLSQLTGADVAQPLVPGSYSVSNGVARLQGAGTGLGVRNEQGHFASADVGAVDFDVKVRVSAFEAASASARVGLVLRESPTNAAGLLGIVVTPSQNGVQFLNRPSAESAGTASGSFPANFPNAWLRLQRSNDVVRGLASYDGRTWTLVGKATLLAPSTFLGVAITGARSNELATATLTDWGDATGESEDPLPSPLEPPGPSSRRTALVITEIHYNPVGDGEHPERPTRFIELYNSDLTAVDLGGLRLQADQLDYVFPTNYVLGPGAYGVVAEDLTAFHETYPDVPSTQVLGPWTGNLSRGGDTLKLWSRFGALLLEVPFTDRHPWPAAADGEGHTLVLARPSWGEADPRAWAASQLLGGSPGRAEAWLPDPRASLRIVEALFLPRDGVAPFVEIFNAGSSPAPLTNVLLVGPFDQNSRKFPVPGEVLGAGQRLVVPLSDEFSSVAFPWMLRDGPGGRVWDLVEFRGAPTNEPLGRVNLATAELKRLVAPTPGLPNAAVRLPRIVLSEVMYRPISGRDDDQYLELWNPGTADVDLSGWRLDDGVGCTLPAGAHLAAGDRAVIARNGARLRRTYPRLSAGKILGEFSGKLASGGERLSLRDASGAVEFGFTYQTGGEWPALAHGGGSSLELLHPALDPDLGSSWAASDESTRAPWQTYEVTGLLEGGTGTINDVRVFLLGTGETLIDDVEVQAVGSTNLLANPNFEVGTNGWFVTGTHERSAAVDGGFNGSARALRLRATGRGDNGINSVRSPLRAGLRDGTNAVLRVRARWLAGTRDLLMRVKGNYLELPVRLDVPEDLGSPGAPNTHALDTPRPALTELSHHPVLPAEGQSVRVTVRPVGLPASTVPRLHYRLDPATDTVDLAMNDAGTDGDRVAGDGIYTGVLPGQPTRTMAAFYVAIDAVDPSIRTPRTTPGREALVRWGEVQPAGSLGAYRIWITRAVETRWSSRARLHNGDLDATFVYGNSRAVYGLGTLYSGSPFVSPGYNGPAGSTLCGYILHFPDDEPFLGDTDFVMDWPIRDDTRQLEQRAYDFAAELGLPYLHRRFVHFFVNSSKRGAIYEDTQQPGGAFLRHWFPDDNNGQLHKIEDWFEFTSSGDNEFNADAQLVDFRRSDGTRNMARYRWNFRPRSVEETAHDFAPLYRLIEAATQPIFMLEYQRDLEKELDFEEWAGVFAVEHAVGNWDSFGYSRGKNMYAYRPERGPWQLLFWDIDFVMSSGGQGPGNYIFDTIDPTISQLYQYPPFQRAYARALKKLVNGPMRADRFDPRVESVRLALLENGVSASGTTAARNYVRDQRAALLEALKQFDQPFAFENPISGGVTEDPLLALTGKGPAEMTGLLVNGQVLPLRWLSSDTWQAVLPLASGPNTLRIAAADSTGRALSTFRSVSATLRTPPAPTEARVVINEIYADPQVTGAEFVELHNPSPLQSFDLSGLHLVGAGDYEFPPNTALFPGQLLVLARDYRGFQAEFGNLRFPDAQLPWSLTPAGETLALVRPAQSNAPASTITAVTYRRDGPWPVPAPKYSLQLRDAARGEDDRVGLWGVYTPPTNNSAWTPFSVRGPAVGTHLLLFASSFPASASPDDLVGRWGGTLSAFGFDFAVEFTRNDQGALGGKLYGGTQDPEPDQFGSDLLNVSFTTNRAVAFTWAELEGRFTGRLDVTGNRLTGSFSFGGGSSSFVLTRQRPPGDLWVDDLELIADGGTTNLLRNGDFQNELGEEWTATGDHAESRRASAPDSPAGGPPNFALHLVGAVGGTGALSNAVVQSVVGVVPGTTYELRGRYLAVQAKGVSIGLEGGPRWTGDLRPRVGVRPEATPGRPNSNSESLPAMAPLWVNEIQPDNRDGRRDASGRAEPWLELHNSGAADLALAGYFLSDDAEHPTRWALPTNSVVPARGFLLVWLDGESAESTAAAPHASFRATPRNGVVLLSRTLNEVVQTVDFLRYADVPPDWSFGHLPETWVHNDQLLPVPSPNASNGALTPPARVVINEWLAVNSGGSLDPADLDADDWFELYNPGATAVDLADWSLTDAASTPAKYRIPAGYQIPPGGFLLVWADEESGQNQPGRPDLHVNFRLASGGEEIALYRPDGTLSDHVVFGAQTAGVSQGREPDGAAGTNYVNFPGPTPGRRNASVGPVGPEILAVERLATGALRIRFVAEAGARYRLRVKDSLSEATWQVTGFILSATGATADLDAPRESGPARFFQIERLADGAP